MAESKGLTFRPKEETLIQLDELAEATDRSKSWHMQQAVEGYLEHQSWQIGHIKKGLADVEAGRVTDDEAVGDWLKSWGTEDEKDAPL
tara:strand:+ start:406 stop:669 length:264 start_codon:yes stop_codon:yes gene_type:complete